MSQPLLAESLPAEGLRRRRAVALLAAAGSMAALARWAQPTHRLVDQLGRLRLDELIPAQVGPWRWRPGAGELVVNPQKQAALDALYSQLVNRIYVNPQGQLLMLSIAYGEDQRDSVALHHPEACYPAQGFQLLGQRDAVVDTPQGPLRVRRLDTEMGSRHEPVTYWTIIGQHATLGGYDKKVLELRYAAHGYIPDGLLFRVSTIDRDTVRAYADQDDFIRACVAGLPAVALARLTGLGPQTVF